MNKSKVDLSKIELGNQPLNMQIYEELKDAIIRGDIPPKSRLTETEVSKQMKVSSTPVREAFRHLSADGLVKIIPWKGVIVQSYTKEEIKEAYQCREVLELLAVRLAVENIDEQGISRLERLLEEFEKAGTSTEIVRINSEIHDVIIKYSGNRKLKKLLESVSDVIRHDRYITAYSSSRSKDIHLEHIEIVKALKDKDAKKAEEAMKRHIGNGFKYIMEQRDDE